MLGNILKTALQSLTSVAMLFILTRIMGKKQLSQFTFFDYVAGISIGSIAASFAVDPSVGYTRGIIALVIYALFPIAFSFISLKSYRARKLLDGLPTLLIQNGQLLEKNLKKTKLSVNDVLEACRLKNAFDVADVEYAILETDGKVSVLLKSPHQPLTPKDMNIQTAYKGLCLNVIIDGEILDDHLKMIGRDRTWIAHELNLQGIPGPRSVLLAYLDSSGQLKFQLKNDSQPMNPLI